MDLKSIVLNEKMKFFLEVACQMTRGTQKDL